MQIRSKAYLQFISLWRSLRGWMRPIDDGAFAETSPILVYAAVVLALLLAILEIDRHRGELDSVGLTRIEWPAEPGFAGPLV
jgi:hypothetical protein